MKKNVTHSVKTLFFVAACAFAATALFTACGNIAWNGPASANALLEFKFEAANNAGLTKTVTGRVDEKTKTVTLEVPRAVNKSTLKASFSVSNGAKLFIGTAEQQSGVTVSDFTDSVNGVKLTVKAEDGTTQDYTVKVYYPILLRSFGFHKAANTPDLSDDGMTAFTGFINQGKRGVSIIKLPVGTTETALKTLKPYFTVNAPSVKLFIKGTELTSEVTPADFSTTVPGTLTQFSYGAVIEARDDDGGSRTYTAVVEIDMPNPPDTEVQKFFGSYYGTLESSFLGKNKVVVVLTKDKVTMYSTAMSMDYINVEWEKNTKNNTYSCVTYKTKYRPTLQKMPQIKGAYGKGSYDFSETGSKITAQSNIMGTPVTLEKGTDFTWSAGSEYKQVSMHL